MKLVIDDIIKREFGELLAEVSRVDEARQAVEITIDLGRAMQRGNEFPPYDREVLEAAARILARRARRLNSEATSALFPASGRWTAAYVRVAALLEDLTVVAATHALDELAEDVQILGDRLRPLSPAYAPWLAYPSSPDRPRDLRRLVDHARAARSSSEGAGRAWADEVLAAAGYCGRPILGG